MAHPIRIQYPGAVYHVVAPGDRGKDIFQRDLDRQCFLNRAVKRSAWLNTERVMGNLSERLGMGNYTRVTQAITRAERRPGRKRGYATHAGAVASAEMLCWCRA